MPRGKFDAFCCSEWRNSTLTFAPPLLDFGQLDGCTSSLEKAVTIINNTIGTGRLTGATSNDASFSVTTGFPIDIAANKNIDVKIKFSPVAEGIRNGTITFRGIPCGLTLPIQVEGDKVDIAVKNTPAGVDFGQSFTCSNRISDTIIVIYNTGNSILNLGQPIASPPYTIVSPASFPQSVKIDDSIKVIIRYAPVIDGNFSQTIRFPYSEGICNDEIKISMNGVSIPQSIKLNPATIQFLPLVDCELYRDTTITIENTSAADIQLDSSIGGGISRVMSPILPFTLKSGEKQIFKVRIEPKNAGVFTSTLLFVYNPCNKKDSVEFSGEKQGTSFVIADTVDAGEIIGCVKNFSTVNLTLENTSTNGLDGTVTSITTGSSITTTLAQGSIVASKTKINFDITVTPVKNGLFIDSMKIILNPCGITKTVYFKGLRTDVVLRGDSLNMNFGKVKIGTNIPKTIFFRNTGSTPLTITTISSLAPPFSIIDTLPSIPAVLQPNDTLKLTVNYNAIEGVQKTKVFAFGTTPCDASDSISIQGEGINDSTQTIIKFGDMGVDVGDKVKLALILMKQMGLEQSGATKFSAKVRFNKHILHITDPSYVCSSSSLPEICELQFSGDYQTGSDTLITIPAEATLGDVESTNLELIDFQWLNGNVPVEVVPKNGEFRLNNICLAGGTRLFRSTAPVKLNVTPNPSNGKVEIEYILREKSAVKVSLTDILGRPVMLIEDAVHESGTYNKTVDIGDKGDGIYFLTMQCPNVVKTIMMSIVK
ncbi:MAG: choice-of-anchor D domain-containing protein [Ignavibacteriae bacterium]|nr:choice-of-anchor D domain-containing protein [Ignavibacteriota bacterium]